MKDLSEIFDRKKEYWSQVVDAGKLSLPTGQLVISDPFQCCDASPMKIRVVKGTYPISLYLKEQGKRGVRVAYAKIDFSRGQVDTWKPALTENDMSYHLVDSGLSSFMDYDTSVKFCDLLRNFRTKFPGGNYYTDVLAKEFKANVSEEAKGGIGEWCLHDPFNDGNNNISMFASGLGDGQYSAWWGFLNDKASTLVIDFDIDK